MKIVLGLGNPGKEYERTRHNVGWWVVDHLAAAWDAESWRKDGDARVADARRAGARIRLVKPQTYMNLSGIVLRPYVRRAAWHASSDLLVIVDDVALPVGRFRFRALGSAGGHNGLKSVEQALGSQAYARLRIGIRPADERREVGNLSDYVLDAFGREETQVVRGLFATVTDAIELWLRDGIVAAMNQYPGRSS